MATTKQPKPASKAVSVKRAMKSSAQSTSAESKRAAPSPIQTEGEATPKTTRPDSPSRRHDADPEAVEAHLGRTLDAFPDKFDIEDCPYHPTLQILPDALVNIGAVPAILDQGTEGACTGFALAAVINYLLAQRGIKRLVSPRMLYEMARRYDEWPGEDYVGSSARGAMKGWQRNGVAARTSWTDDMQGPGHLTDALALEARAVPGGAYYRVDFRQVRHLHAALQEVGIVYVTLMVHRGWELPPGSPTENVKVGSKTHKLPVIVREGRADAGHAVAIVGYTPRGFIVQNSWGPSWGSGGFALLPYEDFMLHATDVWVAQLGVPVTADLWENGAADVLSGRFRAANVIPLSDIRPYVIDIGNNGVLSDSGVYWTTPQDLDRMFGETIPTQTKSWRKRRIMLFLHGGLNDEAAVAKRVIAYRDVCLANEIYPLHIMWESDWFRSTIDIVEDLFTKQDERAGWSIKDWAREARDRMLEITLAKPGGALWQEMKENAKLASVSAQGAMQIVAAAVNKAKATMSAKEMQNWELHVVGHSAGSIFAAAASPVLMNTGVPWRTTQFMAPAITIDEFNALLVPNLGAKCPVPLLYVLSEVGELDDDIGPYGKSLLYLVSNAFERQRQTPLLGMLKFLNQQPGLRNLLNPGGQQWPGIVEAGAPAVNGLSSASDTHGGFDNDAATMNSVLTVILGQAPVRAFEPRDLDF